MIEIACPHCGGINRLDSKTAGNRVPCGVCHKEFKVPASLGLLSGASATEAPDPSPSPAPYASPEAAAPEVDLSVEPDLWEPDLESEPNPPTPSTRIDETASAKPEALTSDLEPLPFDSWDENQEPESRPAPGKPLASDETGASSDEPLWPEGGAGPRAYQDRAGEGAEPVYDSVENPLKLEGLSDASTDDIRAKCKVCDSTLWVKRHKAGTTVLCPDCGSEVAVPAAPPETKRPAGPVAGQISSRVFEGVESAGAEGTSGWREKKELPGEKSERAKKFEQIEGQKLVPKTQQRKWGQAPPPEPEVSAKEESKADNESTEPIDEPLHFDVDDWIKEAFKVMGSSGFWFGISMVFIGYVIYLPYLWWSLAFLPDAEAGMVVRGIAFVLTPLAWLPTIVSKSVVGSTITVDTANRCRRIESWPDLSPTGILPAVLLYMIPYLVSIFPGVLLMQFTMGIGIPAFLAIPVAMLIQAVMFSPVFLSVLRNGSPWQVFDAQIFGSFTTQTKVWLTGYAMVLALAFVEILAVVGALLFGLCFAIPAAIVVSISWGLQMRVIGIQGRRLDFGFDQTEK